MKTFSNWQMVRSSQVGAAFVFLHGALVMLQCNVMVKKGVDMLYLLEQCIGTWRTSQIDELFYEAERCAKQLPESKQGQQDDKHTMKVFTRLMLGRKVGSTVDWMTGIASNGSILDPSTPVDTSGKTAIDAL